MTLPVLLIPAHEPPPQLAGLLREMLASGRFSAAVVVDDGSSAACAGTFDGCRAQAEVTVLVQPQRGGKGAALKAGFAEVLRRFPAAPGVVTADADGQHLPADVAAVAAALAERPDALALGSRAFGPGTPPRSRFGNAATALLLRFVTGRRLADTQTGLRGIPREMLGGLCALPSNGYEFELDMLLACRGRPILEVPIATVYLDGNRSSHFDPIFDSMRIYLVLLRFFLASLASAAVDNAVFALCFLAWRQIASSHVCGRVVSLGVNYALNRGGVFRSREEVQRTLPRYLALALFSGGVGYLLIRLIHAWGLPVLPAKLLAESLLFLFNFVVQRNIVFARRGPGAAQAR